MYRALAPMHRALAPVYSTLARAIVRRATVRVALRPAAVQPCAVQPSAFQRCARGRCIRENGTQSRCCERPFLFEPMPRLAAPGNARQMILLGWCRWVLVCALGHVLRRFESLGYARFRCSARSAATVGRASRSMRWGPRLTGRLLWSESATATRNHCSGIVGGRAGLAPGRESEHPRKAGAFS